MVERILKHIASGKVSISHADTFSLLEYGSVLVKDAIDNVFVESSFLDDRPLVGVIKQYKDIVFFETEGSSPYLTKEKAES